MKFIRGPIMAAMVGVSALGLGAVAPSGVQAEATVPVEAWSLRNVVNTVQLSPDGKHLLVHVSPSREGDYLLQIYKVDDLTKPYRTLSADPMEIISASWATDNIIIGRAWEVVRNRVRGPEDDVRNYATYTYNLKRNKFSQTSDNLVIVNRLPKEPDEVLVGTPDANGSLGVDPFQAFRPRSYYRLNLSTGAKRLVLRGTRKYGAIVFDNDGNPRSALGQDSDQTVKRYYRKPGDGSWKQYGQEFDPNDHENLYRFVGGIYSVAAFDPDNPNLGYMIDSFNGEDKAALWKYDFTTGQPVEKLFQAEDADVMSVITHSMPDNDSVVAAVYPGAKYERHWFDEEEKALYEALSAQIPYAHQVSITGRSRDGNTMVVSNRGPRDPGSYWLVKDGQMAKLGSRNPLVNPEDLADVKYIRYKARDGLEIPAYLTIPKGEGPFPLVLQHHGGPHVNAVQSYNEMGQMLANNGYMVLYPQNRISTGWGKKHFDAGYGEHGLAMQDDKDDGVQYLIDQGLVDPDRVAFYGWSYGGYAALVASQRENNLYQCAIAVAAVADPEKSYMKRRSPSAPKALDDWAKRRGMIGINPVKDVNKANIPLLMVHGDVDARVRYYHYEDYQEALQKAGKGSLGQFLTLEGVDHSNLMYNHQYTLNTKMLDFLKNDCGPGGL